MIRIKINVKFKSFPTLQAWYFARFSFGVRIHWKFRKARIFAYFIITLLILILFIIFIFLFLLILLWYLILLYFLVMIIAILLFFDTLFNFLSITFINLSKNFLILHFLTFLITTINIRSLLGSWSLRMHRAFNTIIIMLLMLVFWTRLSILLFFL